MFVIIMMLYKFTIFAQVPEKSLELKYSLLLSENESNIACYAKEIYPKPEMRLFLNNSQIENCTLKFQERNSGLFNAEISAAVADLIDGSSIVCELHISLANYTVRKEAIYFQARSPSGGKTFWNLIASPWIILITCIFLILD